MILKTLFFLQIETIQNWWTRIIYKLKYVEILKWYLIEIDLILLFEINKIKKLKTYCVNITFVIFMFVPYHRKKSECEHKFLSTVDFMLASIS